MRVRVLTLTDNPAENAGIRIRYERLREAAPAHLHVTVSAIGAFRGPDVLADDAYILSKIWSARSSGLVHRLRQAGKLVGVDLFDNYFGETADVRLRYFDHELRMLLGEVDFATCSTAYMADLVRELSPSLPVLVMPDAIDKLEIIAWRSKFRSKLRDALTRREFRVLWFGVGDNPIFAAGLDDMAANGWVLEELRRDGWSVGLDILTNRRSLTLEGLRSLAQLSIPYSIHEWTLEAEEKMLAESLVAFLPVNWQGFSRAKSNNRALTSFTAACQVLSAGYPLYEELEPYIYRSGSEFLADLSAGCLKVRDETIGDLAQSMVLGASSLDNVERLESLLRRLAAERRDAHDVSEQPAEKRRFSPYEFKAALKTGFPPSFAVLQGSSIDPQMHKLAKRLGGLSVKTPFSRDRLNFDIRFDGRPDDGSYDILIETNAAEFVAPPYRSKLVPYGKLQDNEFVRLVDQWDEPPFRFRGAALERSGSVAGLVASYPLLMRDVQACCEELFPGCLFIANERSSVMWGQYLA